MVAAGAAMTLAALGTAKGSVTAVVSDMTTGDIQVLDADDTFRLLGTGKGRD